MKRTLLFSLALVGASSLAFVAADAQAEKFLAPKISIDKSEPLRSGPFAGYADIVKKVSPSVVSIFATQEMKVSRTGRSSTPQDLPDLFNSPMFREFFGDRGIPRQGPSPAPRRQAPRQQGLGSGVILSEDGYILTNNHVVDNATGIKVQLNSGKEYDAKVVANDPASDLAVIKVDADNLPAATLGDSENLLPGDTVLAIGSPFGLKHTVTSGIVSATGRDNLNIVGYENFIQTDASINPGNSGGALIDNKGRVIGINTAIFSRSGGNVGIGFAIPVNMAVQIADELIRNGEIVRGYLGVTLAPLSESLADALSVDGDGVLINEVMPDSPADRAGFKAGDVVTAVNSKPVEDMADVRRLVGAEKPGSKVNFAINRGGKNMTLNAKIGKMPTDQLAATRSPANPNRSRSEEVDKGALKGVRLGQLDDSHRNRLGLERHQNGVVVLDVEPGSEAEAAGLKPGDVITEINQTQVKNPREAIAKASERGQRATLLRVTDGNRTRFLAIG